MKAQQRKVYLSEKLVLFSSLPLQCRKNANKKFNKNC